MFTKLGTHLTLVDNALIRGYNSIYQQAAHVRGEEDVGYFADYALTWSKFMKVQSGDEDHVLFVKIGHILLDDDPLKEFKRERGACMFRFMAVADDCRGH